MNNPPETSPPDAKILIVDDEVNTCKVLKRAFSLMGYRADAAQSGSQALEMLSYMDYDLMLLDLRMPGIDGVEVMEFARQKYPDLLVIILTAHATISSAIAAVKAGASDYLLKPQSISEIQSAVEKAIRKRQAQMNRRRTISLIAEALQALQDENNDFPFPETPRLAERRVKNPRNLLSLDMEKRRVLLNDELSRQGLTVELTANEASLLSYLMQNPDKVFSNRELASAALGYINISEKEAKGIIRPHITRLRKKIEADVTRPTLIRTVRGRGYVFSMP